ncbi:hypothetical protein OIU84_030109 [Salix udensis]|uniref:Uncharacterized protein n=1 Tax=Salix udensis TaxID=889485 RepID=A0AAD6KAW7_9ROSI|nr:hypothetical protein OIU84_030109 [Salix udensis]
MVLSASTGVFASKLWFSALISHRKMMSVPAILHKPSFKSLPFCPFKLSQAKPISFLPFPASKSDFFGSKNQALSRNMTELVRMSAFRDSNGSDSEESTGLFQQEAVFDGPNEFQSGLLADGLEATLNRLSKWLVAVLFGTVILWRHDAEAMWAVMGSIVNSILSVILKRIFNQERPDSTSRSDPGMPSSHGQSIFFTMVFAILSVVEWLGANEFALILSAFILVFGTYLKPSGLQIRKITADYVKACELVQDMVTGLSRTSYNQPSCGGRRCRIHFLHFLVLVMGFICAQSIYFLSFSSHNCCYGSCCILPRFSCICYP